MACFDQVNWNGTCWMTHSKASCCRNLQLSTPLLDKDEPLFSRRIRCINSINRFWKINLFTYCVSIVPGVYLLEPIASWRRMRTFVATFARAWQNLKELKQNKMRELDSSCVGPLLLLNLTFVENSMTCVIVLLLLSLSELWSLLSIPFVLTWQSKLLKRPEKCP